MIQDYKYITGADGASVPRLCITWLPLMPPLPRAEDHMRTMTRVRLERSTAPQTVSDPALLPEATGTRDAAQTHPATAAGKAAFERRY